MNSKTNHWMKRTAWSLIFGMGLMLANVPEASAHKVEYRPYIVYDHYAYAGSRHFPRWLRKDRDFQRWYLYSNYRMNRHMSWHRLYDIYKYERRYRLKNRRFRGRLYRDHGHRSYERDSKRHRH